MKGIEPPGHQQERTDQRPWGPACRVVVGCGSARPAQEGQGDADAHDRQRQDQAELDRVLPEPDPHREQVLRGVDGHAAVRPDRPGEVGQPRGDDERRRSPRSRPGPGGGDAIARARAVRSRTTSTARLSGIGISNWIWNRPQTPSMAPASTAQASARDSPSVARRNASIANGRSPNTRSRGIDRVERLPDHRHRVDPQTVGGQVQPAGERGEDRRDQRHVPPSGQPSGEEVGAERDDRQPEQAEQGRRGRRRRSRAA